MRWLTAALLLCAHAFAFAPQRHAPLLSSPRRAANDEPTSSSSGGDAVDEASAFAQASAPAREEVDEKLQKVSDEPTSGISGGDAVDEASAFAQASAPAREKVDEKLQKVKEYIANNVDAPPETMEAVTLWRRVHGPERDEDISDVIAGRFCSLAILAGAEAALSMVKNSEAYIINIEPARVAEYFEAWEARVGDRAETIELLRLNPNLMAGQIDDIKTAPDFLIKQTKAVAKAIDFTRNLFGS